MASLKNVKKRMKELEQNIEYPQHGIARLMKDGLIVAEAEGLLK